MSIFGENSHKFKLKWTKTRKCQANFKLDSVKWGNH